MDEVRFTLMHDVVPGDGAGISRQTEGYGALCGVTDSTAPSDLLVFMVPGAEVVLRDEVGSILGTTALAPGETSRIIHENYTCGWSLTFTDVPASDAYSIEVDGIEVTTLAPEDMRRAAVTARFYVLI